MYFGVVAIRGGPWQAHAVVHGEPWSRRTRFAWSLGYALLLCAASDRVGLPEQPRPRRAALLSSVVATGVSARVVSLIQLAAGDALLPRSGVLGSAVI